MTFKDLKQIYNLVQANKADIPHGFKLEGMTRSLAFEEMIVVIYYKSVTDYLVSKGLLPNKDYINLLSEDSEPQEDDYY